MTRTPAEREQFLQELKADVKRLKAKLDRLDDDDMEHILTVCINPVDDLVVAISELLEREKE
jgi:hypothetical protein